VARLPIARELIGVEPGRQRHHNPVWALADPFVGKHLEPVVAQIQPLADEDIHFIGHDHEEFMFVLTGEVETMLKTNDGIVKERFKPGDCLYFRSHLPHCHRSVTKEPALTLNLMYSLRGAIDADGSEFGPSGHQFYRRGAYENVVEEAAEKIALLRRSRGWTLADVAATLGIGVRQLAQIERGERAPDVELMLRMARTFRRPIEYFFATTLERRPHYFVQRGYDIPSVPPRHRRVFPEDTETVFQPLAAGFPERGMHPYYIQLANTNVAMKPHGHHGQGFVYILDGALELVMYAGEDEITEHLRSGDAVFLESSVPHTFRGRSQNPFAATSANIIDVFWSPLGEEYLFEPSVRSVGASAQETG
jgi:transcriptional regulator with XRE-family HTH domain